MGKSDFKDLDAKEPLISFIVPVYNQEKYLHQCVDSLLSQTYRNFEVILVDDGSTDASGSICDGYPRKDGRVRVIHKENNGPSAARMDGVAAATGEYIMMVDGDDWIDADTLEICLQTARENDADVVMFPYCREYEGKSFPVPVFPESRVWRGEDWIPVYRKQFGPVGEELREPTKVHTTVSCCMKLYSAKTVRNGRIFDREAVGSSEDALFNIYALKEVTAAAYTDRCWYHYRKTPEAFTGSYRDGLEKRTGNGYSLFRESIAEMNLDASFSQAVKNRYALSAIGIGMNEMKNPSAKKRAQNLKRFLSSREYTDAVAQLDFSVLPAKWKAYFWCCKHQAIHFLLLLLRIMVFLKDKRG